MDVAKPATSLRSDAALLSAFAALIVAYPPQPETVIVVGGELHDQELNFEHCTVAAQVSIP